MNKFISSFGLSFLLLVLIVATALGFLLGISHPLPWVTMTLIVVVFFINKKIDRSRYLTWKHEYSVGIQSIDNDHKKLLNLINQLQTASLYYTGEEFEKNALKELIEYTKFHFQREEDLMEQYQYPDFGPHKEQHKIMVAKVSQMVEQYEKDADKSIDELLEFLKEWLIRHINGTDQEYSEFLISKGVS